ncbi:hypothetical protein ElyMa_006927300 [Elysia marginata]|uniref:Uncharacterized protein n=1 Tax=Elysia marginata TaxID=1093978 RepID=A0AAV4JFS5_9GAST|nr:hypothetical protein ElyMa_006927300 [Elysia marginata]
MRTQYTRSWQMAELSVSLKSLLMAPSNHKVPLLQVEVRPRRFKRWNKVEQQLVLLRNSMSAQVDKKKPKDLHTGIMNCALQELTDAHHGKREQRNDSTETYHNKDTESVQQSQTAIDPFGMDTSFRIIATGVIFENSMNLENAEKAGN